MRAMIVIAVLSAALSACAPRGPLAVRPVSESGLSVVRIETISDQPVNSHPVTLTPYEVGTLLRGVRVWEDRNFIHRLVSGPAPRTRAFRDDEILFLAPAISRALAEATPRDRVFFHLSHVSAAGAEETTTGWLSVRGPGLHLVLTEAHDLHPPGPDISRYDRQMPDVPEVSGSFQATFEPETFLIASRSGWRWFSPQDKEELVIAYRDALSVLPPHPLRSSEP